MVRVPTVAARGNCTWDDRARRRDPLALLLVPRVLAVPAGLDSSRATDRNESRPFKESAGGPGSFDVATTGCVDNRGYGGCFVRFALRYGGLRIDGEGGSPTVGPISPEPAGVRRRWPPGGGAG